MQRSIIPLLKVLATLFVGAFLIFLAYKLAFQSKPVIQVEDRPAISQSTETFGSNDPTQSARYTIFASSTLQAGFTGGGVPSSTLVTRLKPNMAIGGTYLPRAHGSYLQLRLERSLDNGVTYQPYTNLEATNSETLIHTSSTDGTFFTFPGAITAASNTTYSFSFDLTMIADYVRFSAREVTTSTLTGAASGTITAVLNLQSD